MLTAKTINDMTQCSANMTHSADVNSKTKELTTSYYPPVPSYAIDFGQRMRAGLQCLHCPRLFENLRAMGLHRQWCTGHYKAYCMRMP